MGRVRSLSRQATTVALALAFSLGLGAEVYGLHDCPRHHHDPPATAPVAPDAATSPTERAADGPLPSESAPEGPCTCVGTCHASAASPHPGIVSSQALPATGATRTIAPASADVVPARRSPYLLPYANGPPAAAI